MNNLFFEYVNSFVENIHKIRQHWATRIDHSSILPFTQQNLSHFKTNKNNIIFFNQKFIFNMKRFNDDTCNRRSKYSESTFLCHFCEMCQVNLTWHFPYIWVAMKLNINKARVF